MDPLDDRRIPVLGRLSGWPADRVDMRRSALALQLCDLAVTESLAEGREAFKQVGNLGHGEDWLAVATDATPCLQGWNNPQASSRGRDRCTTPALERPCSPGISLPIARA